MITRLFSLLFSLLFFQGFAQNYEPGELLIQLKSNEKIDQWIQNNQRIESKPTHFELIRLVSPPFDIYQIRFDEKFWSAQELISALKNSEKVAEAQVNHILENRNSPNDLLYGSQWQYNNTGQNGALNGADLDIENAWEHTTGGLTADGDTIVVCVIDGGFELSHTDFENNWWKNEAEIPNNGVDDDGNGYVDDYFGWNAYNNTGIITSNTWHGTPVAGIIGAKGNNNFGVSGISWDIKIMAVSGGGNEAQALAAYTYPYLARKKYNESNGLEGAFVVATNASWGVNYGQAANAPLWCNFYDSLGAVGILNAGATANLDVNVDTDGDLPTQCSSDYLVAVTNINNQDQKVNQAGYGLNSVDLGAFGEGTYTARSGNTFGGFGGTSGATPHVAGTIGLLYAADCGNLMQLAKTSPEMAALKVKGYILQGGDSNASIQNITSTGKRLNIGKSMELLLDDCSNCPSVTPLIATNITEDSASISWMDTNVVSFTDYQILLQDIANNSWDTISTTDTSYTFSNLQNCTWYRAKILNTCSDTSQVLSNSVLFKTEGCCNVPTLEIIQKNYTAVQWQWNPSANTQSTLFYKNIMANAYDSITIGGSSFVINGLDSCETYTGYVRVPCGNAFTNSQMIEWTTKGCGNCQDLDYCEVGNQYGGSSYITQVKIDTFIHLSSAKIGYENFTHLGSVVLKQNKNYQLQIKTTKPTFSNNSVIAWIDFNQDGLFTTAEQILNASFALSTQSFNITIPQNAALGVTRLRIAIRQNKIAKACGLNLQDVGQTEDYCVYIEKNIGLEEIDSKKLIVSQKNGNIFIHNNLNETLDIQLMNTLGQKIQYFGEIDAHSQKALKTPSLVPGIYYLQLKNSRKEQITKKILVR
ncbi:MAG: S8 family serine peptidase [Flavobacteriales bacterium]|jgi:hypothetical protein|nr:S8 family serine peptidase [Flavobacteriales bacterium]